MRNNMKNIQVIDGAENCTYSIYSIDEELFEEIFPNGQDIEFADDLIDRVGPERSQNILSILWKNQADKKSVNGIHGTLFYELNFKKQFYPTKKECEMVVVL